MAEDKAQHAVFNKALALLHSNASDSSEQLKEMMDVIIEKRYGKEKTLASVFEKKPHLALPNASNSMEVSGDADDVIVIDDTDLSDHDITEILKSANIKIEPAKVSSDPNATEIQDKTKDSNIKTENTPSSSKHSDNTEIQFMAEGIQKCKVCKGILLEGCRMLKCIECHVFYHPECHRPPITKNDLVGNSLFGWICRKCNKSAKESSKIKLHSDEVGKDKGSPRHKSSSHGGCIPKLESSTTGNSTQIKTASKGRTKTYLQKDKQGVRKSTIKLEKSGSDLKILRSVSTSSTGTSSSATTNTSTQLHTVSSAPSTSMVDSSSTEVSTACKPKAKVTNNTITEKQDVNTKETSRTKSKRKISHK